MDLCEYFQLASEKLQVFFFFFLEILNEEFSKLYLVVHKMFFKAEASVTVTRISWFGSILSDIGKIFFMTTF